MNYAMGNTQYPHQIQNIPLRNSVFAMSIVAIGMSFAFLMWDASLNSGNIIWTPTIRAVGFMQESDAERAERFQDNPIIKAFLDRYPGAVTTQELKYTGQHIYHTYTNGTLTVQLRIWDTGNRIHYGISCTDYNEGIDFNQGFIKNAMQIDYHPCM